MDHQAKNQTGRDSVRAQSGSLITKPYSTYEATTQTIYAKRRVRYNFSAERPWELSVREGDEVLIWEHPAKSVGKDGVQYEWEGWMKVQLLLCGRSGEIPSSHVWKVDSGPEASEGMFVSAALRRFTKQPQTYLPDTILPKFVQLIAGRPIPVSDRAAIIKLSQQRAEYISDWRKSLGDHAGAFRPPEPENGPPQQAWQPGGIKPSSLQKSQPLLSKSHQDAGWEDPRPGVESDEPEGSPTKQLECLNRTNAMFITYTISEDRSGAGEFVATRLAALGAWCDRRHGYRR